MKKSIWTALAAACLMAATTAATAGPGPVFGVWGSGISYAAARTKAFTSALQKCQQQGFSGVYVEDVDATYGGLVVYYGLAECY